MSEEQTVMTGLSSTGTQAIAVGADEVEATGRCVTELLSSPQTTGLRYCVVVEGHYTERQRELMVKQVGAVLANFPAQPLPSAEEG